MNPGGEPGRDDGGLPPVDIEIPDDARELEREVLAYHREQRARRRRARWNRVLGPMRGHGAILPLVATCVALSMLAGTLLSVFSISPASAPVIAHSPAPAPRSGLSSGADGRVPLPAGTVVVGGKATPVRGLVSAALALVPAHCNCGSELRQLTDAGGPRPRPGVLRGDLGCDGRRDPAGPHGRPGHGGSRQRRGERARIGVPSCWADGRPRPGGRLRHRAAESDQRVPARGPAAGAEHRGQERLTGAGSSRLGRPGPDLSRAAGAPLDGYAPGIATISDVRPRCVPSPRRPEP